MPVPVLRVPRRLPWTRTAHRTRVLAVDGVDQLTRAVVLTRTREQVWSMLTDPEHLAAWLGEGSVLDARRSGRLELRLAGRWWVSGWVEQAEPPASLLLRRGHRSPFGSTTLVQIDLEPHPAGTLLRLVESGRPALEQHNPALALQRAQDWTDALERLADHAAPRRTRRDRATRRTGHSAFPDPAAAPVHTAGPRHSSKATP